MKLHVWLRNGPCFPLFPLTFDAFYFCVFDAWTARRFTDQPRKSTDTWCGIQHGRLHGHGMDTGTGMGSSLMGKQGWLDVVGVFHGRE